MLSLQKTFVAAAFLAAAFGGQALAMDPRGPEQCALPMSVVNGLIGPQSNSALSQVVATPDHNGSLFGQAPRMWAAVVDRNGVLCGINKSNSDAWPGSRAIAIAKAETANDFSNNLLALSTANLYTPTQPGGSLYGLNNSNPFNPLFNAPANDLHTGDGFVVGGIITFGGGVALYSANQVIGGLGVSGDSSCADHAVAFRMRLFAGLNHVPSGVSPDHDDNIIYIGGKGNQGFAQPHCFPSDIIPSPTIQTGQGY
jgi:uncharacterized protein GlcG (DUF336 family)